MSMRVTATAAVVQADASRRHHSLIVVCRLLLLWGCVGLGACFVSIGMGEGCVTLRVCVSYSSRGCFLAGRRGRSLRATVMTVLGRLCRLQHPCFQAAAAALAAGLRAQMGPGVPL